MRAWPGPGRSPPRSPCPPTPDRRASSALRAGPRPPRQSTRHQRCAAPAGSQSWLLPGASRRGAIRPQQRVVELADLLERFLELVVIAEPAAHLVNLFAAQAELASTAAGGGGHPLWRTARSNSE